MNKKFSKKNEENNFINEFIQYKCKIYETLCSLEDSFKMPFKDIQELNTIRFLDEKRKYKIYIYMPFILNKDFININVTNDYINIKYRLNHHNANNIFSYDSELPFEKKIKIDSNFIVDDFFYDYIPEKKQLFIEINKHTKIKQLLKNFKNIFKRDESTQ